MRGRNRADTWRAMSRWATRDAPASGEYSASGGAVMPGRMVKTQAVARVALETCNSPQMIFQHYRELVRPEAAKGMVLDKT